MTELFNTTEQSISLHINNIYSEGKSHRATVKKYLTVQNILKGESHIRKISGGVPEYDR
ncbi:hypothetical protein [Methanoplanus endosymbiosus]|uniref:Uncharacterized protein n=1 Tax=Methanoplanus endosymbiosus TaxID=33865 RepID=A0A9E7TJ61_9EURY|nr:hypothetical protein [Methanoplanus endosymbiosus]UUX93283.1 hypothetical protein L6E24_03935 [Methanoplanus endosymbiosus]